MTMAYFEWTAGMSVGLARLDDDHKGLIAIINRLADASTGAEREAAINQALTALLRYTEYHFAREEAVLRAVNYPHLDHHRDEHREFVAELDEMRRDFPALPDGDGRAMLLAYLKDWLTHHILIEDMAYKGLVENEPAAEKAAEQFSPLDVWTTRIGA